MKSIISGRVSGQGDSFWQSHTPGHKHLRLKTAWVFFLAESRESNVVSSRLSVCVSLCDYMQVGEASCMCFCGLSVSACVCVCLFMEQSIKLSVNSAAWRPGRPDQRHGFHRSNRPLQTHQKALCTGRVFHFWESNSQNNLKCGKKKKKKGGDE